MTAIPTVATAGTIMNLMKQLNGRGRPFSSHHIPALRNLAKEIIEAEATKPADHSVFVVTLSGYDNKWHVHRAGCGHIGKDLENANSATVFVKRNIAEVQAEVVDEEMIAMGWTAEYFHKAPCTKK
jgi:hypothetical protein